MASLICQKPAVDYFTLSRQQNDQTPSPFPWDTEPALIHASDSCDSILPSPTTSTFFTKPSYILPKEEPIQNTNRKSSTGQAFDFGTFEDWMRWDDPSDTALSPTSDLFLDSLKTEPLSPNMSGLELSRNLSTIDEAAVFGGDNLGDTGDQLFQPTPNNTNLMSSPIIDIPSREGLYSTPLSWARPMMNGASNSNSNINNNMRRTQSMNLQQVQQLQQRQQQPILYNQSRTLTPQEEIQLRAIAMPQQSQNPPTYPTSPTSSLSSPAHSPISRSARQSLQSLSNPHSNSHPNNNNNTLKRKSSACSSDSNTDGEDEHHPARHPPIKKTAHNMIEKRYRTNLNDKIALLRDSVPSLRVMTRKCSRGGEDEEHVGGEEEEEDLQGLTPAHKLNKATVLSKATEYINHLEKRTKFLQKENEALKSRVEAFELLVMSQTGNGSQGASAMGRRYGA